jgi:hypothetical protein
VLGTCCIDGFSAFQPRGCTCIRTAGLPQQRFRFCEQRISRCVIAHTRLCRRHIAQRGLHLRKRDAYVRIAAAVLDDPAQRITALLEVVLVARREREVGQFDRSGRQIGVELESLDELPARA